MTPVRVTIGVMLLAVVMGFLVGRGASPWLLLVLPVCVAGFIYANRGLRR